jgi:hypothetical protein
MRFLIKNCGYPITFALWQMSQSLALQLWNVHSLPWLYRIQVDLQF